MGSSDFKGLRSEKMVGNLRYFVRNFGVGR